MTLPPLPEWSLRDDLGGLVASEVRTALREYARAAVAVLPLPAVVQAGSHLDHQAAPSSTLPAAPQLDTQRATEGMPAPVWQDIATVPKDGTPFLAWYPKVRLDDDDNLTDEVVGGAWAIVSVKGKEWDEPGWLNAQGAYYFDDCSFAEMPTHWQSLPAAPKEPQHER